MESRERLSRFILDTNILIYLMNNRLAEPLPPVHVYCCSFVTELELLSYKELTEKDEALIRKMLTEMEVYDLNSEIKRATILLRRKYSMKLPDAIIAATSIITEATLMTNDKRFQNISEIQTIDAKII